MKLRSLTCVGLEIFDAAILSPIKGCMMKHGATSVTSPKTTAGSSVGCWGPLLPTTATKAMANMIPIASCAIHLSCILRFSVEPRQYLSSLWHVAKPVPNETYVGWSNLKGVFEKQPQRSKVRVAPGPMRIALMKERAALFMSRPFIIL
jgi:hypothetical protein